MIQTNSGVATPAVHREKRALRIIGTSSTLIPPVLEQAEKDLGVKIQAEVLDGSDAHRKAIVDPGSFDLYDQWFHNLEFVWTARSIQPIDTRRLKHWTDVGAIGSKGRLVLEPTNARGGNPNGLLFVQPSGELGAEPSDQVSMLPITHGAEAFGYLEKDLPAGWSTDDESWSWLLAPEFKGAVLQNNPSIGVIDAIMAAQAAGIATFEDPGNLSLSEIDILMEALLVLRKQGHFSGFWGTPEDLIGMVGRRHVKIFSLWSSASGLAEMPCRMRTAVPKEGYRGWYGGIAISRYSTGRTLDLAYEFLNWWLDGWPSSYIARQGYYFSAAARARAHMDPDEWDYWFDGKPAKRDMLTNYGTVAASAGEVRTGGSYAQQMSRVRIWNSVMDEHNYLSRRWHAVVNYRR